MGRLFARCLRDEGGGEPIEFVLSTAVFGMGAYAYANSVGIEVRMLWQRLDDALSRI